MAEAGAILDALTKPPGSLGRLEWLAVELAGITGTPRPTLRHRAIVVAAADHGVTRQGVSAYPADVTAQMVANFVAGGAAINALAAVGRRERRRSSTSAWPPRSRRSPSRRAPGVELIRGPHPRRAPPT